MPQALKEHVGHRKKVRLDTELFSGYDYVRVFTVPRGDVAAHLAAELAPGAVLPVKWGGVATSTVQDPRLQAPLTETKQSTADFAILETHWVSIDVA